MIVSCFVLGFVRKDSFEKPKMKLLSVRPFTLIKVLVSLFSFEYLRITLTANRNAESVAARETPLSRITVYRLLIRRDDYLQTRALSNMSHPIFILSIAKSKNTVLEVCLNIIARV